MKTEIANKIIEAPEGVTPMSHIIKTPEIPWGEVKKVMNRLPLEQMPSDKAYPIKGGVRVFNGDAWLDFGIERYQRLIPLTNKSRIKRRMEKDLKFIEKYKQAKLGRQL